jgi:hypothetical protein
VKTYLVYSRVVSGDSTLLKIKASSVEVGGGVIGFYDGDNKLIAAFNIELHSFALEEALAAR